MVQQVRRSEYLGLLHEFKNVPSVMKVITGMRRCGKSTLLEQFMSDLKAEGVDESQIYYRRFDTFTGLAAISSGDFQKEMRELKKDQTKYVLLDEIQSVPHWELIAAALQATGDFDIYLTGSNSDMLSGDLATHIAGRYIEVRMLPLSFKEYLQFHPGEKEFRFEQYLRYGGLPDVDPELGDRFCRGCLEGVFNSVLVKDVLSRLKAEETGKLLSVTRFLYFNVGNVTNRANIAKGSEVNSVTVERYLHGLVSAHLFYHAERYDIVGKKLLSSKGKYYASDLGLRYVALDGSGVEDISRPLENLVYLELLRRGYTVRVGSYKDHEVDFTAVKGESTEYYQVTQTMYSEDTRERELRSLNQIKDNWSKTVLTLDRFGIGSANGICIVNLIDWLLE